MSTTTVGIIGLGVMGREHARTIRDLGALVVGGVDVNPAERETFGDEFDVPTFEDHSALFDVERPDAIVITTPNRFHEEIAVAALERDVSVLIEKPLAHSLDSAKRIAEAEAASEGICMVGFHNRFTPAAVTASGYVDDGRLGEIVHIEADLVRRRGIPSLGSWFTSEELAGGGTLIDIGVHVLDLVLYLLDFPHVVEVMGTTRQEFGSSEEYTDPDGFGDTWDERVGLFDVEDSATALLRTADGTTISLDVAWAANKPSTNEITIRGTDAGLRFELGGDTLELFEAERIGTDHYVTSQIEGTLERTEYAAQNQTFLQAVDAGVTPDMNTIHEGLHVQHVIDAIYRSSDQNQALQLTDHSQSQPCD